MTRRQASYIGPLCPADPSHGPLLSWAGTPDYWCGHSGHALPASEYRNGGRAETIRWFTLEEVEAAQRQAVSA